MPISRVMLIRHAEKPSADGTVEGVTFEGVPSADQLSVRGWQRAGALFRFFAPLQGTGFAPGIATPTQLVAPKPTIHVPSRSGHTLAPLAELLGLSVRMDFSKGQEADVAAAIATMRGTVLVAWEHKMIRSIAVALADEVGLPLTWPDERFDMVWAFDGLDSGMGFSPSAAASIAGDRAELM